MCACVHTSSTHLNYNANSYAESDYFLFMLLSLFLESSPPMVPFARLKSYGRMVSRFAGQRF